MGVFFQLLFFFALLYLVGRLTNPKKLRRVDVENDYSFIVVLGQILLTLLISAVLIAVQVTLLVLVLALYTYLTSGPNNTGQLETDVLDLGLRGHHFDAASFMLGIAIIIFLTAVLHFELRRRFFTRCPSFRLNLRSIEISEYFIQWSTIYLAVYQFIFDGLKDIITQFETSENVGTFFNIALSPQNINLVLQPLLIASWITLVIEKIRLQRKQELEQAQSKESQPS